ncbi:MAG: DUF1080 domain-containing protein [Armatimonadetes bacterium]|nr:DUF1080 domain-containing protein [Armatimonadota bacterium]MBS1724148.1 DUF1080 domain-containing protein [Armatimonadota bacterium]
MITTALLTVSVLASRGTGLTSMDPSGFITLFNGKSLDGWKGWRRSDVPKSWSIENGVLACSPNDDGGDLTTKASFTDFDLRLDWKISEGGNSGIFFRGSEDEPVVWQSAPEYQLLDDKNHPDGQNPLTRAASCYALFAPTKSVNKPAGQWNSTRIVAKGNDLQHWLNGKLVLRYTIGSAAWKERYAKSKFSNMPEFASHKSGPITLQDHGLKVWFRNIRIKRL